MHIATSIDWSFFNPFLTEKRKQKVLLTMMIVLYILYENIEFEHHAQMRGDDNFWTTWSWIVVAPSALWWLWAEYKDKVWHLLPAGLVFLFTGPILSMGSEIRNIHIFSGSERNQMLLCIITGSIIFALYIRSKVNEW